MLSYWLGCVSHADSEQIYSQLPSAETAKPEGILAEVDMSVVTAPFVGFTLANVVFDALVVDVCG